MTDLPADLRPAFIDLLLAVADDKLLLGHRDSDWTGLGPILEEDIASSALAQDEIAHAQAIYDIVGELEGTAADALAFGRPPDAFRCAAIVELSDEFDWARFLARRFFCDHFDALRVQRLAASSYTPLAQLARRIGDEEQAHVAHVNGWIVRLGQGTAEARQRLQAALDTLAPLVATLFEPVANEAALETAGLYPPLETPMLERYRAAIEEVAARAGVRIEIPEPSDTPGGRRGHHTPQLAELLEEMCEVYRLEPGVAW